MKRTLSISWRKFRHDSLDSTNLEAHRLIANGFAGKGLVVADEQTAGYGRHSRVWESARGKGLWASFILPAPVPAEILAQSSLVLGVAVREAVQEACGLALANKWPNDLLHDGRKCCGLLAEADFGGGTPMLILGAGINVDHSADDFPCELRRTAVSLRSITGTSVDRAALLSSLADAIDAWIGTWQGCGFAPVREAWLAGNCTTGREVVLPAGYTGERGTAIGLGDNGGLLVRTPDGALVTMDSGEILFT